MIFANDLRRGTVFLFKDKLHICLEYQHNKTANRRAMVRAKLKDLTSGSIYEYVFSSEEKLEDVQIERRKCEYLYNDGEKYHFMDQQSFEQFTIDSSSIKDEALYLVEGTIVEIDFYNDSPIFVHPPIFVELEVVETDPGLRGDTVSGGSKPAILSTGLKISVPLFISVGDVIKIDTRTNEYVERVKKSGD